MSDDARSARKIFKGAVGLDIAAGLFVTSVQGRPERAARDATCSRWPRHLIDRGDIDRLSFESCGQDKQDRVSA